MIEPSTQAYTSKQRQGWYFVRYSDGNVSMLMTKLEANSMARIFGGAVERSSLAPKATRWFKIWSILGAIVWLAAIALVLYGP